jgi:hypothetical protein
MLVRQTPIVFATILPFGLLGLPPFVPGNKKRWTR